MKDIAILIISFGATGTFLGWFLYQRSLARMIEHIKLNHYEIWLNLGCLIGKSPPDPFMGNPQLRNFIIKKDYASYTDLFLKEIGDVVKQRLLFSIFCLMCLATGIFLYLVGF
jgi:hypothetical protein